MQVLYKVLCKVNWKHQFTGAIPSLQVFEQLDQEGGLLQVDLLQVSMLRTFSFLC